MQNMSTPPSIARRSGPSGEAARVGAGMDKDRQGERKQGEGQELRESRRRAQGGFRQAAAIVGGVRRETWWW